MNLGWGGTIMKAVFAMEETHSRILLTQAIGVGFNSFSI